MAKFVGTWKFESETGGDETMKAMGVPDDVRAKILQMMPQGTTTNTWDGTTLTMTAKAGDMNEVQKITKGGSFNPGPFLPGLSAVCNTLTDDCFTVTIKDASGKELGTGSTKVEGDKKIQSGTIGGVTGSVVMKRA